MNEKPTASTPVFVRDYGLRVTAEYRIGPEITCEAVAIKYPDGWIIDSIETIPKWRLLGHARYILERIVEISGMPVRTLVIAPEAEDFWLHMVAKHSDIVQEKSLSSSKRFS